MMTLIELLEHYTDNLKELSYQGKINKTDMLRLRNAMYELDKAINENI